MKVSDGFSVADSRNLPIVDLVMLLQFMRENDCFNIAEIRGAKVMVSSRDSYVETSVGYVEVKRENSLCFLKGRVTPEHRVRCKLYTVTAVINEIQETIEEVSCQDCAASDGGCKHTICFLMWLIKRTEEPSVTSVSCYWAKPKLADAVSDNKFSLAKEMGAKRKQTAVTLPPSLRAPIFIEECKKRKVTNSLLLNYTNKCVTNLDKFSIYQLMLHYINNEAEENHSYENFITEAKSNLSNDIIEKIEKDTYGQAENALWHIMRQGRISASKIYEVTRCKTDGVLVKSILGGYKVPETTAIRRGRTLEKEVLKKIEKELKISIEPCGFKLINVILGASPDGVSEEFVVEIKCPSSEQTIKNYVKNDSITAKFKAQVQLQMHAMNKRKALFCVADPKFEENKKISMYWQYYDKMYVKKIIEEAELFWKTYIYKEIMKIVKC